MLCNWILPQIYFHEKTLNKKYTDNFEINHSTDQSNLKTNEYGTKDVESDRIDGTTSTSAVISNKKKTLN